jgi:hypothetical protein
MRDLRVPLLGFLLLALSVPGLHRAAATAQEAEEDVFRIDVRIVVDDRFPPLKNAAIDQILDEASTLMKQAFLRDVEFVVHESVAVDAYLRPLREKHGDLLIDCRAVFDPTQPWDPENYLDAVAQTAKQLSALESSAERFPDIPKDAWETYDTFSAALLERYHRVYQSLVPLLAGADGQLDATDLDRSFYSRIYSPICMSEIPDSWELVLYNGLLIDDALSSAPPHTLVRGGIMNGVTNPTLRSAWVACYQVFSPDDVLSSMRDRQLSEQEQIRALAAVIAHEVGAHGIELFDDNYVHAGCLASPPAGLNYGAYLDSLASVEPCKRDHGALDLSAIDLSIMRTKMDSHLLQERWEEAGRLGLEAIRKAGSERDRAWWCHWTGIAMLKFGKNRRAAQLFNRAASLEPAYIDRYVELFGVESPEELTWLKAGQR